MAIDYSIDYKCFPKQELTTEGILERIKGRARADAVVDLFRRNGDDRPASEMGFEFVRSTPEGAQETRVIYVQEMLDRAAELTPYETYCQGCPANNTGVPFGCMGQIEYPISGVAEIWLLNALPTTEETLPWLLLKQAIEEFKVDGSTVNPLRAAGQTYFQEKGVLVRRLGEIVANTNQIFEMLFTVGHIKPSYASILLLLFKAISRSLEADQIMAISKSPDDAFENHPFLLKPEPDDDASITQFKQFFRALYLAWGLNVPLLLDV
ncbi:MAG: hypothetical protein K8L97_34185 [Anaerolineae bacterium]|nr:hypothetical protein [Anaerolineae bacterium]